MHLERGKGGRYRNALLPADLLTLLSTRPAFLLPVRVLGKLFRRLFLSRLIQLYDAGKLAFFGSLASLAERRAFLRHLAPVRKVRWVVYAKAPFAGPEAVLAYLSRYTHRVAISNRRLISFDKNGVTLRYKDYRRDGPERQSIMTLTTDEFIRRFPWARPSARLSPYPPLRLAGQFVPKSQPRSRTNLAGGCGAA